MFQPLKFVISKQLSIFQIKSLRCVLEDYLLKGLKSVILLFILKKPFFFFRVLDLKDVLKELKQTTKRRTEPLEYFVVSFLTLLLFFFPLTL